MNQILKNERSRTELIPSNARVYETVGVAMLSVLIVRQFGFEPLS